MLQDYDDESDSDIEDVDQKYNRNGYGTSLKAKIRKVKDRISKNTITQSQNNIIKCALAYIHLIVSVAVFFNPAKTIWRNE